MRLIVIYTMQYAYPYNHGKGETINNKIFQTSFTGAELIVLGATEMNDDTPDTEYATLLNVCVCVCERVRENT